MYNFEMTLIKVKLMIKQDMRRREQYNFHRAFRKVVVKLLQIRRFTIYADIYLK